MVRRFYYKKDSGEVTVYTNGGYAGCSDPWALINTTALQEIGLSRNYSLRIENGQLKITIPPHKIVAEEKEVLLQKIKAGTVVLADLLSYISKT